MNYYIQNKDGVNLITLREFSRKEFETSLFSYELKLKYCYNNEFDEYYYDEEDDEEVYYIKKDYIEFIHKFLNMFDSDYSNDEIINYFNNNYEPPYTYTNLQNCKIIKI